MLNLTEKITRKLAVPAANFLTARTGTAGGLAVGVIGLGLAGCGSTERVCRGTPQNLVVVASTGHAELATSRAMAREVGGEAVARAADSCGRLLVGLLDAHPEADLGLQVRTFAPQSQTAYNRTPQVSAMRLKGSAFVQNILLKPLMKTRSSSGAPFLGALVVLARELHERGYEPATIILLGNGLGTERAPDRTSVDLAKAAAPEATNVLGQRLREFQPLLQPLAGSCVILVGAGAGSSLPDSTILASQALLAQTLAAEHIGFVPTRSPDLPSRCTGAPALAVRHPRPRTVMVTLSSDVVFQLGSASLQPAAQALLQGLLVPLAHAQAATVNGYTDSTGDDRINVPLSRARAAVVAEWIEHHAGIPATRVRTRGLGPSDPIASNATAAGRSLNRRVVITIRQA